jgi:hypothetical protein
MLWNPGPIKIYGKGDLRNKPVTTTIPANGKKIE